LDNTLYGIIFDSVTLASTGLRQFPQSQGIADSLAGDPSCVFIGPLFSTNPTVLTRRAVCGVRDLANNFRVAEFSGTAQGIETLSIERPLEPDEVVVGDPSCALAGTSAVICAVRAPESSLAVIALVGSVPVLREFLHLDGPPPLGFMVGDPSCVSTSVDSLILAVRTLTVTSSSLVTCGVRGTDNALSAIRFAVINGQIRASPVEQGLPGYLRLGGELTGNPSCASTPSEVVTCGVRGTDGALYLIDVDAVTGQTTGTYDRLTGVVSSARGLLATDPTCVAFGDTADGNVACGILNLNNVLNTIASARTDVF
jgi:hypothetical protein